MPIQSKLAFSLMSKFTIKIVTVLPEGPYDEVSFSYNGKCYLLILCVVKQTNGCPKVLVFSPDWPPPCDLALFCDGVKGHLIGTNILPLYHHEDGTRVTRSEFKRRCQVFAKRKIENIPLSGENKRKIAKRLTEKRFSPVNDEKYH